MEPGNLISFSLDPPTCFGGRRKLPEFYLDHSNLAVKSKWLDALRYAKWDENRLSKVKGCNKEGIFLIHQCVDHPEYEVTRPYSPCNDSFCLFDSGRYGSSKGVQLFKRLKSLSVTNFGYFVFTTPQRFWISLYDRKMINKFHRVVYDTLREFYGLVVGGFTRVHVWGDKKAEWIGRKEVHMNAIIPLVGFDKDFIAKKISPFLRGKKSLSLIRGIYKKNFLKAFIWTHEGEFNIYYRYIQRSAKSFDKKLMNLCQYVMRPPLELPLRDGMKKVANFGLKRYLKIIEHFKFYEKWRSVRWFGWMAGHVIKDYLKRLGFDDREISRYFEGSNWRKCPICGLEIRLVAIYCKGKLVAYHGRPPSSGASGYRWTPKARVPVKHSFEALKEANPIMPDWMINEFLNDLNPSHEHS